MSLNSGMTARVDTPRALKRAAAAMASAVLLVVACANDVESRGEPSAGGPGEIATNLDVPWGIAFLPDGSALIAERNSGAIKHMTAPGAVSQVGSVAGVAARGEGGLLGLATAGPTVFAYLTTGQDNRVVQMRFDGERAQRAGADPHGYPRRFHPRRRAHRVRPGRQAVCRDG